jgi:hypothetical protein
MECLAVMLLFASLANAGCRCRIHDLATGTRGLEERLGRIDQNNVAERSAISGTTP